MYILIDITFMMKYERRQNNDDHNYIAKNNNSLIYNLMIIMINAMSSSSITGQSVFYACKHDHHLDRKLTAEFNLS